MSIETIHLRKLLKLLYLTPNRQTSELRSDIRQEIAKEMGGAAGGGDFHVPFWRDARDHVFHRAELSDAVKARIESNSGRERLYPALQRGFLTWWNQRRRWTNEPFEPVEAPHARLSLEGLGTIKVENMLAVRDADQAEHFVYPYFAEAPTLGDEAARLGLWVIGQAIPAKPLGEIAILDLIRGQAFSVDQHPLRGDEGEILNRRFATLLARRRELFEEYL